MNGNKTDNGVLEIGTVECRASYQEDTPGQRVDEYLSQVHEVNEARKKKAFSQVFQNPLKGFPYNETLDDNIIPALKEEDEIDLEEGKYQKYSDLLIKKAKLVAQGPIASKEVEAVNKQISAEMKKLNVKESENPFDATTLKDKDGKKLYDTGIKEDTLKEIRALPEAAPKLPNLIPQFQKIVKTKSASKVGGTMVDMFTASVITRAYDKVNDKNKKRMETSNVFTLIKLAQKIMGLKESLDEGAMSELLIDIQQGATAKELSKTWKIPMSVAKDFLKDYYSQKKGSRKEEVEESADLDEEKIVYQVKGIQKPESDAFTSAAKLMKLKVKFTKGSGGVTLVQLDGTKSNLRKLDGVVRGKSTYGDPSTSGQGSHFDESFDKEEVEEGSMDGQKLTGQEISSYFRRNKVRDKTVKKAVELALDHGGAMSYAIKQIEKLKRGLSKNKDVEKALNYANFGENYRVPSVGVEFLEGTYTPYNDGKKINKNIATYWKKLGFKTDKELLAIQSMYMITDHNGVVQMYKAGKRSFEKSVRN